MHWKTTVGACVAAGFVLLISGAAMADTTPESHPTADHSKFEALKREFASGPEVTAACLACHTEASDQVKHSIHWKWDYEHPDTGQKLGKSSVINAFCGNVASNEARCTSCHTGYGWEDMSQPPPQEANAVDCLVCHDTSGEYTKLSTGAGHPPMEAKGQTITGADAWPVNLSKAAQSVGAPGRENCGGCHFYGGGGDNVKHGDLSSALYEPARDVDVHMSADGQNFTCSTCHVSEDHVFAGSRYNVETHDTLGTGLPGHRRHVATCESCHGDTPHPVNLKGVKLNDHTDKVACQTCHIPEFARGGVATKTVWDWSTAGRLDADGKPIHEDDFVQSDGKHLHTYLSTKGDFEWGENVEPYYAWFDGQVRYTLQSDEIDPTQVVEVNKITGSAEDGVSKIWPFKRMVGRQAYDSQLNRLVFNHVWGPTTDTAFWTNFDYAKSIEAGMKAAGAEYSGEFGFVDTYMYWPITHMVAPAENAMDCAECHAEDGRMVNLAGIYMPGTDSLSPAGMLGRALVVLTALGVLGHLVLRLFAGKSKGDDHV
ncbi:tetrathionate reductase family octaheme c-type cytochrome [Actibacterium ureilyticum]|uniref:tetrathionate reductase family octaheme c-type cytochrome n=1 Tax=Actibacterium ureilyticum TaxID=1590614 RepID=UPI000BAAEEE8|nr:tetrathionate reductase family octaheme c-type cytochrome [Actibacterium ureilyticum]